MRCGESLSAKGILETSARALADFHMLTLIDPLEIEKAICKIVKILFHELCSRSYYLDILKVALFCVQDETCKDLFHLLLKFFEEIFQQSAVTYVQKCWQWQQKACMGCFVCLFVFLNVKSSTYMHCPIISVFYEWFEYSADLVRGGYL